MTRPQMTVVGGGIGGLSAAIALARSGIDAEVLERASEFRPIGYGIQLGPNALYALEKLGIEREVLAKASLPEQGELKDACTGELLLRLPMAEQMEGRFGKPYAVIHRADLHEVLVGSCDRLGVRLVTNCELLDFEQVGETVRLKTSSGERETSVLLAADGNSSRMRSRLFGPSEPEKLGYAAFRAVRPMEEMPARYRRNTVTLWCGGGFHMISYPLRGGTLFNLVAVLDYRIGNSDAPLADRLIERFDDACGEVKELLRYLDFSKHWEIMAIEPIAKWSKGRVALLGDAAHSMLQAMSQGACQALEDAVVLGDCLKSTSAAPDAALRDFEARRILRATRVQYMSRFMWELIHARAGYSLLRQSLLGNMDDAKTLESLSWLYSEDRQSANGKIANPRYEPAL